MVGISRRLPCVPRGCLEVWRYLRPEADYVLHPLYYYPKYGDIFSNHGIVRGGQVPFSDISSRQLLIRCNMEALLQY